MPTTFIDKIYDIVKSTILLVPSMLLAGIITFSELVYVSWAIGEISGPYENIGADVINYIGISLSLIFCTFLFIGLRQFIGITIGKYAHIYTRYLLISVFLYGISFFSENYITDYDIADKIFFTTVIVMPFNILFLIYKFHNYRKLFRSEKDLSTVDIHTDDMHEDTPKSYSLGFIGKITISMFIILIGLIFIGCGGMELSGLSYTILTTITIVIGGLGIWKTFGIKNNTFNNKLFLIFICIAIIISVLMTSGVDF